MNLLVALCLLCSCVAPHYCRSVDAPTTADIEPLVSRRRHEENIAELLIPLLERSLAQSEARSAERLHKNSKPGKKVIQVLPYRGSEEQKRKGWRKLNSHKKQVVEITPLHGKNGAKPLAYILSATKQNEKNEDVSSGSASDSHQQSSEEKQTLDSDDFADNHLRTGDTSDSPSGSSVVQRSSENYSSKESKDQSVSDEDLSVDVTKESVSETSSDDKSEVIGKAVTAEETEDKSAPKYSKGHIHKSHVLGAVTAEDKVVTAEQDVTKEADFTAEDESVTAEDVTALIAQEDVTTEVPSEEVGKSGKVKDFISEVTEENTLEVRDVTSEVKGKSGEVSDYTTEEGVTAKFTAEIKDVSSEVVGKTGKGSGVTSELKDVTLEDVTAETYSKIGQLKEVTAEITAEDVTAEKSRRPHNTHVHQILDRTQHAQNDISVINNLLGDLQTNALTAEESEASPEHSRSSSIENDIVISHGHHDVNSAENSISKLFNARARDIIEMIQSSVEVSTPSNKDCQTETEKHSHDHKSYRLSFLFNKK